jgi:hypothetical protein
LYATLLLLDSPSYFFVCSHLAKHKYCLGSKFGKIGYLPSKDCNFWNVLLSYIAPKGHNVIGLPLPLTLLTLHVSPFSKSSSSKVHEIRRSRAVMKATQRTSMAAPSRASPATCDTSAAPCHGGGPAVARRGVAARRAPWSTPCVGRATGGFSSGTSPWSVLARP